jgi:hypothetical protein
VVAVRHQCGMCDPGEPVQAGRVGDPTGGDRVELSVAGLEAGRLVAVVRPGEDAIDELRALADARGGPLEEEVDEVLARGLVGCGRLQDVRGEAVHLLTSLWAGAGQHEPAHELRPDEGEFLGDEATEREPEDVECA